MSDNYYHCKSNWTLDRALIFWRDAERIFRNHGFLCAIYGSVLRGGGRDLDLLVIPNRLETSSEAAVAAVASEFGATMGDRYQGLMGTDSWIITLHDGRVVDIQTYKPGPTITGVYW